MFRISLPQTRDPAVSMHGPVHTTSTFVTEDMSLLTWSRHAPMRVIRHFTGARFLCEKAARAVPKAEARTICKHCKEILPDRYCYYTILLHLRMEETSNRQCCCLFRELCSVYA